MATIPRSPEEHRALWQSCTSAPYGYCWCGCGEQTQPAKTSKKGCFKGEPAHYLTGHHTRAYSANRSFFNNVNTEQKAYWLGFMASDGCVRDSGVVRLAIASRDAEHLELFRQHLEAGHPVHHYKGASKGKSHYYSVFSISSRELAADLAAHGVTPRKTHTLTWPDGLHPNLYRHFLRGYSDGDGSFYTTKSRQARKRDGLHSRALRWELIGTEPLLEGAKQYLVANAGVSNVALTPHRVSKGIYALKYANTNASRIFDLLYDGASVFLQRKYDAGSPYVELEPYAGSKRRAVKLTDQNVREIRHLAENSRLSQTAIGERYGVYGSVISRILSGQRRSLVD